MAAPVNTAGTSSQFSSTGEDLARRDPACHGGYVCVAVWEQKLVHVGGSKIRVDSGEPRGGAAERKTIVRENSTGLIIHYGRPPRLCKNTRLSDSVMPR